LSAGSILKQGMDPADKPREDGKEFPPAGEGWGEGVPDGSYNIFSSAKQHTRAWQEQLSQGNAHHKKCPDLQHYLE
jgi:hypothetical protein